MAMISPEGNVYQAGTLSGNPVAMAAGIAQLKLCLADGFYEELEKKCNQLVTGIRDYVAEKNYPVKLFSIGSIFWIAFTGEESIRSAAQIDAASMKHFRLMYHALLEKGIYLGPSGYEVGFVSSVHTQEDILMTVREFEFALNSVFDGVS